MSDIHTLIIAGPSIDVKHIEKAIEKFKISGVKILNYSRFQEEE